MVHPHQHTDGQGQQPDAGVLCRPLESGDTVGVQHVDDLHHLVTGAGDVTERQREAGHHPVPVRHDPGPAVADLRRGGRTPFQVTGVVGEGRHRRRHLRDATVDEVHPLMLPAPETGEHVTGQDQQGPGVSVAVVETDDRGAGAVRVRGDGQPVRRGTEGVTGDVEELP